MSYCVIIIVCLQEGKLPLPPAYIFMIDVSYASVQTGLLSLLSQSILSVLDTLPGCVGGVSGCGLVNMLSN